MRRTAAAAPRCRRQIGLATVILLALCSLGLAPSQALASGALPALVVTEATLTAAATGPLSPAPDPDPKPAPKPDPKPNRPIPLARPTPPPPPPPPPPPAAPRPAARSSIPTTKAAPPEPAPSGPTRPKAVPRKTPAPAAATLPRRRPRLDSVPKARRESRPVRPKRVEVRRRSRPSRAVSAATPLDLNAAPTPVLARSDPSLSNAVPVVLPLVGLGLLLLLGASVVSVRRVPRPALAEPLYAHRVDVAAIGIGAIALALLWLNVTVVF
jgi:hypothetical protein